MVSMRSSVSSRHLRAASKRMASTALAGVRPRSWAYNRKNCAGSCELVSPLKIPGKSWPAGQTDKSALAVLFNSRCLCARRAKRRSQKRWPSRKQEIGIGLCVKARKQADSQLRRDFWPTARGDTTRNNARVIDFSVAISTRAQTFSNTRSVRDSCAHRRCLGF